MVLHALFYRVKYVWEHTNLFSISPVLYLSIELLLQQVLEGLAILSELLDTLMEFFKRHRVLKQCPAELGLVVDVGDFRNGFGLES